MIWGEAQKSVSHVRKNHSNIPELQWKASIHWKWFINPVKIKMNASWFRMSVTPRIVHHCVDRDFAQFKPTSYRASLIIETKILWKYHRWTCDMIVSGVKTTIEFRSKFSFEVKWKYRIIGGFMLYVTQLDEESNFFLFGCLTLNAHELNCLLYAIFHPWCVEHNQHRCVAKMTQDGPVSNSCINNHFQHTCTDTIYDSYLSERCSKYDGIVKSDLMYHR